MAAVALLAGAAAAGEPGAADEVTVEGLARVGWRLLHGDDDGRFRQDVNLRSGPRLVDLDVRVDDAREGRWFDVLEVSARDLGDRTSDAAVRVAGGGGLAVDGRHARDRFSYDAAGDPFPRDSDRERTHAGLRWAPARGVALRAAWDRSARNGEGFALADSDLLEQPRPGALDPDRVRTRRPFEETFDTLSLGADVASGGWRVGLALTGRRGLVDDERVYDVPAPRRGTDPVREVFRRRAHVEGAEATLKVARSFLDDALETTLVVTRGRHPADADLGGAARGVDNAFEGLSPRGAFRSVTAGATDLRRDAAAWELAALWHAARDVDVHASVGQEEIVDDATLRLVERRRYERPDVGRTTTLVERAGRTTQRLDRSLLEVVVDATDDVRLRAGHETLQQDVEAPFETRGDALVGSEIRSFSRRWIAGVDVQPAERLDLSVLARLATDDEPPATPSPETADDVVLRARWRDAEGFAVSAVGRQRELDHDGRFDSLSRVRTAALSATWTRGPWTVDASLARQSLETRTDTSFFLLDTTGFRRVRDTVAFGTRDVLASLVVRHEIQAGLRAFAGGHAVRSRGDSDLAARELSAGLEHDLADDLAAGVSVHAWRYDEHDRAADDYDARGVELWLEYRFR